MKRKKTSHDFDSFMQVRNQAANAYVKGDFKPLSTILPKSGQATFFGPGGGSVKTARKVSARYAKDAQSFKPVGKSKLKIMHRGASGDLAYWVGIQDATGQLRGMKKPVPMKLRITEIFAREGKSWKMIHRHADMMVEAKK